VNCREPVGIADATGVFDSGIEKGSGTTVGVMDECKALPASSARDLKQVTE